MKLLKNIIIFIFVFAVAIPISHITNVFSDSVNRFFNSSVYFQLINDALSSLILTTLAMVSFLKRQKIVNSLIKILSVGSEQKESFNKKNEESEDIGKNLNLDAEHKLLILKIAKSISERLESKLYNLIINKLNNKLYKYIDQKYKKQMSIKFRLDVISDQKEKLSYRIEKEIKCTAERSRLNLFYGISVSFFGIVFLILSIFNSYSSSVVYNDEVNFFRMLIRFSVVISTQVLGFFFLRIYKSSMIEIKYFQNELTNIELIFSALLAAISENNGKLVEQMCVKMASTERNFILKKGETTIGIKEYEFSEDKDEKYFNKISNIINMIKK